MIEKSEENNSKGSLFILFTLLYVSNDTLLFGTNSNRLFFGIHIGILLIVFGYMLSKVKTINKNLALVTIVLVAFNWATQIINFDNGIIKYIYQSFLMLTVFLLVHKMKIQEFIHIYKKIMQVLAIASIILFFVSVFANPIIHIFPRVTNESDMAFSFFGLGFLEQLNYGAVPRSYGIFREPGVYTCFLILAIVFELFAEEQLSVKRVGVCFFAILLTFSTAAYIVLGITIIVYFLKCMQLKKFTEKQKNLFKLIIILSVVSAALMLMMETQTIIDAVFGKLYAENASRDSRFGAIGTNLRLFKRNPIFGNGWSTVESLFESISRYGIYKGNSNTNTLLKFLAVYGMIPFAVVGIGIYRFFSMVEESKAYAILLSIIWFITLSNSDLSVNFILYTLPFYGWKNTIESKKGLTDRERLCSNYFR